MSALRKVLFEDKIDILFLQEPHLNKRGMINELPTESMVFKCDPSSWARNGISLWGVFVLVLWVSSSTFRLKLIANLGGLNVGELKVAGVKGKGDLWFMYLLFLNIDEQLSREIIFQPGIFSYKK